MTVFRRSNRFGALRCERGQALIEFALCSVMFLMLIFGILEFSRAIFYHNEVARLARDGARFAIVRGTDSGRTTDEAAVRTFLQNRAVGFTPTVTVTWPVDKKPGSVVNVVVTHTFTSVAAPFIPLQSKSLSASSRMTILR